jgi:hypothetical protein
MTAGPQAPPADDAPGRGADLVAGRPALGPVTRR